MKKIISIICSFAILCFSGCDTKIYHWEFPYHHQEISQILIVEIVDLETEYCEIVELDLELAQELYSDITNMAMRRYGPNLSHPSGKCFLFVFNNGEYDIISQKESKHFKYDNGQIIGYNSWLYYEVNEFESLMNKYLNHAFQ